MQSASAHLFDEAYYQRFYFDKKTSVVDPEHMERLGMFVCSYLKYLRVPVRRVLDVGCGIGLWKGIVERHFPGASYQGVEFSPYLCERFGWQQGSVVDYAASEPFDWVICQGVLPYLNPADLKAALHNLGRESSSEPLALRDMMSSVRLLRGCSAAQRVSLLALRRTPSRKAPLLLGWFGCPRAAPLRGTG